MYLKFEEWGLFSVGKMEKRKSKIFGFLDERIFLNAGIEVSVGNGIRFWRSGIECNLREG